MPGQLKAHTDPTEDQHLVPSAHAGPFTIAHWAAHNCLNSSPRGATTSGLPRHLRSDAHTHTQTHMQTHTFKDSCIKVRHDSTCF